MQAVRGQGFSKDMLGRWFNKLVSREEYDKSDKKELVRGFIEATQETLEMPLRQHELGHRSPANETK